MKWQGVLILAQSQILKSLSHNKAMKNTRPRISRYRLQGIAAALGKLARAHMEPDLAHMVLDSLALSVADLEAAGADPHDLEPLQK